LALAAAIEMRPITETVLFDDALEMVMREAQPVVRTEVAALVDADGRIAAGDVVAAVDVPPFDRAAMDGYAVVAEDTFSASSQAPKALTCVGVIYTGQAPSRVINSGECVEIATGAPMPAGADAVVMVEETERDGERTIRVLMPVYPRQHVGRRGADITSGQTVVARGQLLNPSRIGALAATGVTTVEIFARPSVAILSTGNEIVEPGEPLRAGQIYDINRFTLEAIVARHGGAATALPITADAIDDLSAALAAARAFDIVVFSGGSSVGERDLILDVLRKDGEVLFHGVAVKPGKPTVFGRIGPTPFFGMPGYPTSCLSNAYMLLVPLLRRVARLPPWQPQTIDLPLARRIVSTTGRHQFYTVRIADGRAEPAFKASGDITSMANADGYIEIPAQTDVVEAGTVVTVKIF
jgi:molybdenum cofactor synthesis domain-containing protein